MMHPSGEENLTQVVNGTSYHRETPADLVTLLESLRASKKRVRLIYGDVMTGKSWGEDIRDAGTIGRSGGVSKVPLLIRTSRSMGGEAILDHCIIEIRESKGGRVLYTRVKA